MAGTKSRFPKNKYNFIRLRRIYGATTSDLPVTDDIPIDIVPRRVWGFSGSVLLTFDSNKVVEIAT